MLPNIIANAIWGMDSRSLGSPLCQLYPYLVWATSLNAGAHLIGLAVDRVLTIRKSEWHNDLNRVSPKLIRWISVALTMFHFVIVIPNFLFYKFEDAICEMKSNFAILLSLYRLIVLMLYGTIGFSSALMIATVVFIRQLRENRTLKTSDASKPEGDTGAKEKAKTDPEAGATNEQDLANGSKLKDVEEVKATDSKDPNNSHLMEEIYCGPSQSVPTPFRGGSKKVVWVDIERTSDAAGPKKDETRRVSEKKGKDENSSIEMLSMSGAGNKDRMASSNLASGPSNMESVFTSDDKVKLDVDQNSRVEIGRPILVDDIERDSHQPDEASGSKTGQMETAGDVAKPVANKNHQKKESANEAASPKDKVGPLLSPREVRAIQTVQFLCIFFVEFLVFGVHENPLLLREVHMIDGTMLIMFLDRQNSENT